MTNKLESGMYSNRGVYTLTNTLLIIDCRLTLLRGLSVVIDDATTPIGIEIFWRKK